MRLRASRLLSFCCGIREFAAGLTLGCMIFKPQLGLAAAIVFICMMRWKIVLGAVLSAAAQIGVGVVYYGIGPFRVWLQTLWHVPSGIAAFEPRAYQTHCLRTFWAMLLPWSGVSLGLYLISAIVVLYWTIAVWRREEGLPLKYSALLLATVLVSPHLTVYDLAILAPVFVLLADYLIAVRRMPDGTGSLLYSVYMLPLLGPFTRWIHVQLSVIAMAVLLYWIWRRAGNPQAPRNSARPDSRGRLSPHKASAGFQRFPNRNDSASGKRCAQADSW